MEQAGLPRDSGGEPNGKRSRSAKQARASRKNGSESKGPITEAGKQRSRGNAVKHGLLANRIYPPGSNFQERQAYLDCLEGLTAEFNPQTQSEQNLVEQIALDWIVIGRIAEYTAHLVAPKIDIVQIDPAMAGARHRLAVLKQITRCLRQSRWARLRMEDFEWLRKMVLKEAEAMSREQPGSPSRQWHFEIHALLQPREECTPESANVFLPVLDRLVRQWEVSPRTNKPPL